MRQLVKFWRTQGFSILLYLDDGIGGDQSFERADFISHEVRRDIIASGFTINDEKSNWCSSQFVTFLGTISVFPREELANLKRVCRNAPRANLFKPVHLPLSPDRLFLCHVPLGILRGYLNAELLFPFRTKKFLGATPSFVSRRC